MSAALSLTELVAHHSYGSYDLAARCIQVLAARGAAAADGVSQYLAILGKHQAGLDLMQSAD